MKYPRITFAIATALGLCLGVNNSSHAKSLEEELSGLIIDHPQIRAGRKTVESSRLEIEKTMSGYLPTVSATAAAGPEYIDSPTTRANIAKNKWSRTKNVAGLTITQNLFSGFSTESAVQTARLNRELARNSLEGTLQSMIFEGISNYIDVLRQIRLIELSRSNEATITRQLNLEDERVQSGAGITVDVLQAKSRLQIAKERRVTFEGALEDGITRYTQTYNHPPDLNSMTDPVPPVELIPSELEKAIDIALAENPAIASSNITIEVARERKKMLESEYSPVLDLVTKWNYEKHSSAVLGTKRDYSVVVQSTWDLFTGFSTSASKAQAAYDYGASRDNFEYTSRKVVEQIRLAWQALLTSRERLVLLENAVTIASEVFLSRKRLREAGKETVINVLDAENEVNNAQINYTSASYDERLAIYQLLMAMGRLNSVHLNIGQ